MTSIPTRIPTTNHPAISDRVYRYGSDGFKITDISRAPPSTLNHLLQSTNNTTTKLTKKYLTAQLHHYAIPFRKQAPIPELKQVLKTALQSGKCDHAPPEVLAIETSLRTRYDALNKAHLDKIQSLREKEFEKVCGDPARAVEYDAELFVKHYFLNDEKAKSGNQVVVLKNMGWNRYDVKDAVASVPGLCLKEEEGIMVVGWSSKKVEDKVRALVAEENEKIRRAEEEAKEEVMRDHKELVKRVKNSKDFTPRGRYLVTCTDLTENYPEYHELSMTIMTDMELPKDPVTGQRRLMAEFDFGVLEGVMRFWREGEEAIVGDDDSDDEYDEDRDDDEDDDEPAPKPATGSKRKQQSRMPAPKTQIKKAKSVQNLRKTSKLLLQWRGRENGEGEIQVDLDNSNRGYIKFSDNTCTAFTGKIALTFVGANVDFSGIKLDEVSEEERASSQWREFSERAYEYARVNRWR